MAETLKPCPFCGSDDVRLMPDHMDRRDSYVLCRSCGARSTSAFSAKDAVEMWNQRTERTCRIVRYVDQNPASRGGIVHRCSSCGKAFPRQFFSNGWTRLNYCPTCGCRVTGVIAKEV